MGGRAGRESEAWFFQILTGGMGGLKGQLGLLAVLTPRAVLQGENSVWR